MLRAALERIGQSLVVVILCSVAVFFAGNLLATGSVATVLVGPEGATPEQMQILNARLGLNTPLPIRYIDWAAGALHGDFGISPISGRSGTDVIAQELPISLELMLLILLLATLIGVVLGVMAAVWAGKPADFLMRAVALTFISIPGFIIGTFLILAASSYAPGLMSATFVPLLKDPSENLVSMLLPTITGALPSAAMLMQITRATMLESLSQPYATMANARGIPRWRIYFVHSLKNSLPSVVTFQGFNIGVLLGSLFIIETLFSLPGLARGLLDALNNRDYVLIEAQVMVIAIGFILGNLAVDLLIPLIDPRLRSARQ